MGPIISHPLASSNMCDFAKLLYRGTPHEHLLNLGYNTSSKWPISSSASIYNNLSVEPFEGSGAVSSATSYAGDEYITSATSYAGDFVNYVMSAPSYASDFVNHATSIMSYASDFVKYVVSIMSDASDFGKHALS